MDPGAFGGPGSGDDAAIRAERPAGFARTRGRQCHGSGRRSVSRHHARIEWVESGPQVTDLGSANGTRQRRDGYPNGRIVSARRHVQIVSFQLTLREPGRAGRRSDVAANLFRDKPALLTRADPPG